MKRAFLLEDDIDAAILIEKVLNGLSYEVVVRNSYKEAFELLSKENLFDLIFWDYNLKDGYSLDLFGSFKLDHIPKKVLSSAYLNDETISLAHRLGIDICLKKPIDPIKIKMAVSGKN